MEWLPVRPDLTLRVLVFKSKSSQNKKLRPLHLDIHGGAFLGGLPELDGEFCDFLAKSTGAVVISTTYRYAPEHTFPATIDDIDSVVSYLQNHAVERYGADPNLMTVSGFSAGGNLALAACQPKVCHEPSPTAIKGAALYYASIDLRPSPDQKLKPPGFPTRDPLSFLIPLFDSYAHSAKKEHGDDPRLNPILAPVETIPKDILMIIPTKDILLHEQLTFLKRVQEEAKHGWRIEVKFFEGQLHGWDKLPFVGPTRTEAMEAGISFLKGVYEKYGFVWGV